jgi:hypothetical protein
MNARLLLLAMLAGAAAAAPAGWAPGMLFRAPGAGRSMAPALSGAERFRVVHCDFARIHAGDLVLRRCPWVRGGLVLHRARGRIAGGWITRGDANPRADPGLMLRADFLAVVAVLAPAVQPQPQPMKEP